ncbi:MAG: long-chain-fatty-acid--CoA ligase [Ardenticatenaceae bacterium]|nr:long-chain-fatty-acid--CoA ligase [Ardenticatenaceae bacterium]HBY95412.1 long-chain fatty acid--CoA ligase [Chloroflexota bacterium]
MHSTTVGNLYDRCVTYYGDSVAIRYQGRSISYEEMGEKAYRLAKAFDEMGLRKGDRVALLMANCPEYIFAEYALAKLGVARVPLAVLLQSGDHIYMMNHSECVALIYHEKMASRVIEMMPALETVKNFICVSDDSSRVMAGHVHLQTLIASHPPQPPRVETNQDDLCGVYYTGGTTGRPKGVMLSHRAWVNSVLLEMLELGLGAGEVFAYMTPLTHAGGVLLLPVLLRKGTCVILDRFDPQVFLQQTETEKVTATFVVPTMIYVLLDYPDLDKYDTSSLRNIIYGAAPIAPDRLKQALSVFGPILTQLYGQTEAPMVISVLPREEHVVADPDREKRILSSCGRPTVTTQLRLVNTDGNDVPVGEVGEIVTRSINVMDGYFKNPGATASAFRDGWLYTGDLARQDEAGFLYIVDRSKDMIVSGGFNIYPREVEDVLFEHPAVKQAAVIGVPHEKWGEAVKAIVVLHEGQTTTDHELIEFVKERKGSLIAPKSVEFWDAIPLTNLGKLDKKKMRAQFWEGYERRV